MKFIIVDPKKAESQLVMLTVGSGFKLVAVVMGLPKEMAGAQIHIQKKIGDVTRSYVLEPLANSMWFVSVPANVLTLVGDQIYSISGTDDFGESHWFGTGKLRVLPSISGTYSESGGSEGSSETTVKAGELYVKNRKTGMYHKFDVDVDEDGMPFPVISSEGVYL